MDPGCCCYSSLNASCEREFSRTLAYTVCLSSFTLPLSLFLLCSLLSPARSLARCSPSFAPSLSRPVCIFPSLPTHRLLLEDANISSPTHSHIHTECPFFLACFYFTIFSNNNLSSKQYREYKTMAHTTLASLRLHVNHSCNRMMV